MHTLEKVKKDILSSEEITGRYEEEMLQEVERIFGAMHKAHEIEVKHYQNTIQKLSETLNLAQKKPAKHKLKNAIEELRKEVMHFEETHPAVVSSVEKIIALFGGLGMA